MLQHNKRRQGNYLSQQKKKNQKCKWAKQKTNNKQNTTKNQKHFSLHVCVCSGVCREGDRLVVGPTDEGKFLRLKVCSMQRNRSACRVLRAGQAATLALGNFDRSLLRKVNLWRSAPLRVHAKVWPAFGHITYCLFFFFLIFCKILIMGCSKVWTPC